MLGVIFLHITDISIDNQPKIIALSIVKNISNPLFVVKADAICPISKIMVEREFSPFNVNTF